MNKEPNFIYDPQKSEWKTIYIKVGTIKYSRNNNKNTSPYTFNRFKQAKSTNQYKSTQWNKSKAKYKSKYNKTWQIIKI